MKGFWAFDLSAAPLWQTGRRSALRKSAGTLSHHNPESRCSGSVCLQRLSTRFYQLLSGRKTSLSSPGSILRPGPSIAISDVQTGQCGRCLQNLDSVSRPLSAVDGSRRTSLRKAKKMCSDKGIASLHLWAAWDYFCPPGQTA